MAICFLAHSVSYALKAHLERAGLPAKTSGGGLDRFCAPFFPAWAERHSKDTQKAGGGRRGGEPF